MHELVLTEDGSHTLLDPVLHEHYHSVHGALQESMHIFINAGLVYALGHLAINRIRVLEVGFGTGLNTLLTQIEAIRRGVYVDYTTIESSPLAKPDWERLNYPFVTGSTDQTAVFRRIHQVAWDTKEMVSGMFALTKVLSKLEDYDPPRDEFHVVFFDAFSPDIQPELWTPAVFEKLYSAMTAGGIIVTYSVKGIVVRALRSAGFRVEKLPGPPGKRHILRGTKV